MGWIGFSVVWFVILLPIVWLLLLRVGAELVGVRRILQWAVVPVGIVFWVFVTLIISLHQVPAGHVGVVYEFGAIVGQTDSGLQVVAPWRSIKNATVQLQTLAFIDDTGKIPDGATRVGEGLDSFSQETQNVYIDAIVNIEVSPTDIQGLYRNVGPNYVSKLIPGRVSQIFKDETVNYNAVDIAPNREAIRANVEAQLVLELAPYSIDVRALLIENISFDAVFEDAITQKQVAQQNALRERELVEAEKAKADQKIEAARGEGERLRVEALGQADANRLLAESLTEPLIRFQALQKLSDNIRIALIPSGEGLIIDPTTLLQGLEEGN